MRKDIKNLVQECDIYQVVKSETTHPAGLMQPLPIHQQIWTEISMDFIDGLPKSQGYDTLLVMVDRLSKYGHFIPLSHPYTTSLVAELFMKHIFKFHGLLKSTISNKDPIFLCSFWKALFQL